MLISRFLGNKSQVVVSYVVFEGLVAGMNIYLDEANVAGAPEWQQRSSYWVKSGSTKHGTGSTIRTESYMGKSGP